VGVDLGLEVAAAAATCPLGLEADPHVVLDLLQQQQQLEGEEEVHWTGVAVVVLPVRVVEEAQLWVAEPRATVALRGGDRGASDEVVQQQQQQLVAVAVAGLELEMTRQTHGGGTIVRGAKMQAGKRQRTKVRKAMKAATPLWALATACHTESNWKAWWIRS